ncbi:MAG: PA14 domain-containing protein, partial [Panacibacter sp.]
QSEKVVYDIMGSDSLWLAWNRKYYCDQYYKLGERISKLDTTLENALAGSFKLDKKDTAIKFIPNKAIPLNNFHYGRNNIRITPWGPYNFSYPFLFFDSMSNGNYNFSVLQQNGNWRVIKSNGFKIVYANDDRVIAKADSSVQERSIQLQYYGAGFTDMFGKIHEGGKPYIFGYEEFDPLCTWNLSFYKWKKSNDPNKDYKRFINALPDPVFTTTAKQIDYTWWGSPGKDLPKDSFATVAITTMDLPADDYEISVTGDDMVKLFIDKKTVINAWNKKFTKLDENTHHSIKMHLEGKHAFLLVHAENDGLADLMFYIKPYAK